MSIAANLPPRAKRLSLRLAEIGIPIPPRVTTFLDGPEAVALEGALAWGIENVDSDRKLKITWASGRLHDLLDLAVEAGHTDATRYLPIATIGSSHMFAVDTAAPALAVYTWDSDAGFKQWAEDFESFTRMLRRRGEKSPSEKLDDALEKARELTDNPAGVIELLTPAVDRFPPTLTDGDDGRDECGEAYQLLGTAWLGKGDVPRAQACFERGLALGNDFAVLDLCRLHLDRTKNYEALVAVGERHIENIWRGSDTTQWFQMRNLLGHGYLLTERPRLAMRMYHQISTLAVEDEPKVREAIADLNKLRERPQADRQTIDTIIGWLDVPPLEVPPAKLAALRAWWPGLPEVVREAIREAVTFSSDSDPTDAELIRVSRLTELAVTEHDITDVSWVSQLEQLEDLDLTENDITELGPIAALPSLIRLDVSNNKITDLRPLAKATRLQRLVVDENPLAGLEGLEQLHELEDLSANEAGIESLEPLRGLRALEELSVYENRIADLSPLASCLRLKTISCFTNPITSGLAALGVLPRLESVDAGDESNVNDVKALRYANPFVSIDQWYPDEDKDKVDITHEPDPTARDWWNALPKIWKKAFIDNELHTGKKEPDDDELNTLLREDSITIEKLPLGTLEPMRKFLRADYLCLENDGITDLSPLSRLPRLADLLVRDNPKLDLVSLAPAEKLEELFIDRCWVSSLIGLEHCRLLRELHAEDNHVDDLRPLAELLELRVLDLENNQVSNLAPLAKLTKLRELRLGLTRVTDLAPLAGCTSLSLLEVWGTPRLVNALALAALPNLTTVISHGGISPNDIAELRRRKPHLVID